MEERVWTACWQFQPKVLNIHLEFSPTWSCVSLTWSTASSEWKLFRFDKIEVNYFQILLVDVTFIVSVATGDFIIILNVLGQWWTTMFHFLSSSQTLLPSLVHCLFAPDWTLTMINSALSHDPRSRLLLDTPPLCTNVRLMAWDSFSRPRSSLTHSVPLCLGMPCLPLSSTRWPTHIRQSVPPLIQIRSRVSDESDYQWLYLFTNTQFILYLCMSDMELHGSNL